MDTRIGEATVRLSTLLKPASSADCESSPTTRYVVVDTRCEIDRTVLHRRKNLQESTAVVVLHLSLLDSALLPMRAVDIGVRGYDRGLDEIFRSKHHSLRRQGISTLR